MSHSVEATSPIGRHRTPRAGARRIEHLNARRLSLLIGVLITVLALAAPAGAFWNAAGFGSGSATTTTLSAPTGVSVPANSLSSVAVSWTAPSGPPSPTGYYITRTSAGITVAACGSSATVLVVATTCTDTPVASGSYTYVVTAAYRSWTAASAPSGTVVVWTPTQLAVTGQPTNTVAGISITPAIAITVENAGHLSVPVANISITVAIGTDPGSGTLVGTHTAVTNASGVATFAGLSIDTSGVGYTLVANSAGLTSATSTAFTITAAAPSTFAITSPPLSGPASATANLGSVTVQEQDAFGNLAIVAAGGTAVTLSSSSAGTHLFAASSGGIATTTVTLTAGAAGSATFYYGDERSGTPTLTVSGSLASATQLETITSAAAYQLVFGQQPTNTARASAITPAITVNIEDMFFNQTSSTATVAIAIANNAGGLLPGALYGVTSRAAVAGTATFSGLSIDGLVLGLGGTGNGYTLKVTSSGLTSATSNPFNVT